MRTRSLPALLLLAALVAALGGAQCSRLGEPNEPVPLAPLPALGRELSFETDVKPVLDGRCVVCHSCNDAPCQLQLSSPEGALRGATKGAVYDSSRLRAIRPTRLFDDAGSSEEWRARGFFPVLGAPDSLPGDALLLRMLALGRTHSVTPGERLPEQVPLEIGRELQCPADAAEFDAYARGLPLGGMPYAMAPLPDHELRVLATWAARGARAPAEPRMLPALRRQLQEWEKFLNGSSRKQRLSARYLYEHWFLAHLYFEDHPAGPFFRVVRSRTPPGEQIDVIATVRPFDSPGQSRFWYRLRPIRSSIVHKTHIPYPLSPAKLARLDSLFLKSRWKAAYLPGYDPEEAANPFVVFDQIPARSRYQFLLDDAQYFVMTFIRGPVCRGQVAVDVIEDHFFITFLDPDHDLSVNDPAFLDKTKRLLSIPAERRGSFLPHQIFLSYARKQHAYLDAREAFYEAADPQGLGPSLEWIWDGDGHNPNALLSVFRNFDNATVRKGFLGPLPKTGWVMDYPVFERIYYDLVAGFDVYGNVAHQISTRLYMDHLRMQNENLLLSFLPADRREEIRASWYVGATKQLDYFLADRLHGTSRGTQLSFRTSDPVAELFALVEARSALVAGPPDLLNRCKEPECDRPGAPALEQEIERELRRLAGVRGGFVPFLPEVALLRVRSESGDRLYGLVSNRAHTSVAFMFGEEGRRVPEQDTLCLVRGHFGSYPNFVFEAHAASLAGFVDELLAVRSQADLERLAEHRGVRRSDPHFWETLDWLHSDFRRRQPLESGLYDLGRYRDL